MTGTGIGTGITLASLDSAIAGVLVLVGTFFLTVGTLGLLRFPDVYNRMHATTKATTLGAASILLAGFVQFGPLGPGHPSLVAIVFLFITAPTGAHVISRAARKMGVPFAGGATWPDIDGEKPGEPEPTTEPER